jgi:hypothetical protein
LSIFTSKGNYFIYDFTTFLFVFVKASLG